MKYRTIRIREEAFQALCAWERANLKFQETHSDALLLMTKWTMGERRAKQ